jgi:hypothetical protein
MATTLATLPRPRVDAGDYPPVFSAYVENVPDGDLLSLLKTQIDETIALWAGLTDAQADYRYEPGKWSTRDVIGHLADSERIMIYRAVCFARAEKNMLPGFDEDAYVANANFGRRSLAELLEELRTVRAATVSFLAGLDEEQLSRRGLANNRPYSVLGLAYVIAGHERHHRKVYLERYLPGLK